MLGDSFDCAYGRHADGSRIFLPPTARRGGRNIDNRARAHQPTRRTHESRNESFLIKRKQKNNNNKKNNTLTFPSGVREGTLTGVALTVVIDSQ